MLLASQLPGVAAAVPQTPAAAGQDDPAAQKAYVALSSYSEVAVVDIRTNRVRAYIAGLLGAHDLAMLPDGTRVYVGTDGLPTVSVIDTATDTVRSVIHLDVNPSGLAVSPDGRELLVSLRSADEVIGIDTASNSINRRIAVSQPERIVISPDGRRAYVVSAGDDAPALTVLDLPAHAPTARIALEAAPSALRFGPDGQQLYLIVPGRRGILVLDARTGRVAGRIAATAWLRGLTPIGGGRAGVAVGQDPGALEFVDLVQGIVTGSLPVGTAPASVAVAAGERRAYVADQGSGDITVVDLDRRTVIASINVGFDPTEIVIQTTGLETLP